MPRPFRPASHNVALFTVVCCAALGPAALQTALAAAAGTLLEAAPFVLVAEALPLGRMRHLATALGCGCGSRVPGALSPIALALCWLTFGPAVTLARGSAGVALLAFGARDARPRGHDRAGALPFDAFAELLALAPWAGAAAVLAGGLANADPAAFRTPVGIVSAVLAGLALGYVAPCGTAAVALAAALVSHAPAAAWSLLLTGGLAPRALRWPGRRARRSDASPRNVPEGYCARNIPPHATSGRLAFARLALCVTLAGVAATGTHGLVNPRLVPLFWLASALAFFGMRRSTREPGAVLVPAIVLGALLAGAPPPPYVATATELGDAFPGERLAFTGVAERRASVTVLERFAITCCRVDASPISVRLAAPLAVANGSWIEAHGALEQGAVGLVLRTATWRRIRAPADAFVYR